MNKNQSTEKKKQLPAYHGRMNAEHADQLYMQILKRLGTDKLYRDPNYTARQLSEDLGTNTRYISSAVALHTGSNYNALINGMRLRDACRMLTSPRYRSYTVEEIGLTVGFSSRQAFYLAFNRVFDITPREYRLHYSNPGKTPKDTTAK